MDADLTALITALHAQARPCVLAVTGGGSAAVAALLSVPGASRTVLDALIPYHAGALADFLGFMPPQACSAEISRAMAQRAFDRARRLEPDASVVGLGLTAALATDRPRQGDHRVHITVETRAQSITQSLVLNKGQRDRAGEEAVLTALVLNALAETAGIPQRLPVPLRPGEDVARTEVLAGDALARLIRGEVEAVCLEIDGRLRSDAPRPSALLCGAFNPLHDGHRKLAEVAEQRLGIPVAFELSVRNADKPPLSIEEAERRLRQFNGGRTIWLTAAPTFAEKTTLFPGAIWVVGRDTAERVLQARFYGGESQRDAALKGLRESGSRFLVAGRVNSEGQFIGVDGMDIPDDWRSLFEGIPEQEFRSDLSSTQLRG